MIKSIVKHLIYGMAGGCVLFVVSIVLWDLTGSGRLYEFFENFTVYALAYVMISTGFSMSSIVYEIDRLAMWLKISINVVVGFGIFFLVGPHIGILPLESPPWIMLYIGIAVVVFIAACFLDYLFNGREANKINAKLKEQESKES